MHFLDIFFFNLPLKRYTGKIALTTF
jgi:hypothetical protein